MSQERIARKTIDELAQVYADPDLAVLRTAGSVADVDQGRLLVALFDEVADLKRAVNRLLAPEGRSAH